MLGVASAATRLRPICAGMNEPRLRFQYSSCEATGHRGCYRMPRRVYLVYVVTFLGYASGLSDVHLHASIIYPHRGYGCRPNREPASECLSLRLSFWDRIGEGAPVFPSRPRDCCSITEAANISLGLL